MAITAAEQYEPFLKKTVLGNILDQVDNYQYNAKLYMIPPVANPDGSQNTDSDVVDARADIPDKDFSGQGGYLHDAYTVSPNNTVVLAQTGVTGAQIDNIEINSVVGPGNSIQVARVNFDIIQPGAADFLDQIIAAKAYLGDEVLSNDVPVFLEIIFKGYTANIDDEDLGGQAVTVAGPYRYRLAIKNVSLDINEEGSRYAFETVSLDYLAYADTAFRMPKKLESIGTTIDEHVKDLVKKINEHNKENNNDYQIQDEIEIDISGLTEGKYALKDLSLTTSSDVRAEEINRIMNPELEGKTEDEYKEILENASKDEGTLDIIVEENRVTVRENVTIERYIATLLSMNDEFFARAHRSVKGEDPANTEVRKDQPFIDWFRINAGLKYLAFDRKRNIYAKKIVYKPVVYKTAQTNVQAKPRENSNLSPAQVETRIQSLPIFKAYHYLFTGLNDQVLNARIEYKAGVAILTAPAGGVSGDFSTVLAKSLSNSADPQEDLTGQDLATAAVKTANQENQSALLDKLFNDNGSDRENDIRQLGNLLGLSSNQVQDAVDNRNGQNAQRIKDTLADRTRAQALQNAQVQQGRQTASDNLRNTDRTDYQPQLSGYTYAADIIGSVSERLDQAAALSSAQQYANNLYKEDDSTSDKQDAGTTQEAVQQRSIPNQAEDGTYDGTPRNTIFGYLMQQHGATDFLVNLDIQIKGDPWFLGPAVGNKANPERPGKEDVEDRSDVDGARYSGDDNYILFDLQTPRRYDFNVADEDSAENSGYWSKMGTAYFISGIYQIKRVTSTFSQGEFTQELDMFKQTPLDLKKIEAAPEATAED